MQGLSLELPTGYYLERDPDVLILRRLDGSMVGAFSARGAAPEAVRRTIEETAHREPSTDWETPATARSAALRARFFGHFEMFATARRWPSSNTCSPIDADRYHRIT